MIIYILLFHILIYKRKIYLIMSEIIGRVGWRNYVSPLPNPLWNGMLAYYTGDNTADDAKGTANGTLTNGATYGTGKINGGFSFDGINDTITLSNTVTKFSSSTPFTYNVWVKAVSRTGFIYMDANASTAGTAIGFYGGALAFAVGDVAQWFGTSVVIPLNTWTMVTVTYNGIVNQSNNLLFYTNGTLAQGLNMDVSFNLPTASSNKQIGSGGWRIFFNGNLDELGIWSRAITSAEITELYNAGSGKQYVAPTPTYTTRTTAFATATGITDTTILNALNTFDTGLISNGLDTDLEALYPFVGGTSTTHQYNFMNPINSDAAFRLTFNGGWVHSSTGALPNGSNAYAKTWWNPATQITGTIDNGSFGFYIRQDIPGGGGQDTLFCSNGSSYFGMWGGTNAIYPSLNDANAISFNPTNKKGFFQVSRTSTSNIISSVGTQQFSQTQNTNSKTNAWVSLGAWHEITTGYDRLIDFSSKEISMAYLSKGKYTQAQQTTFYNLVQAMQTSLSRQV